MVPFVAGKEVAVVVVVVVEALFIWDGVKRHRELISPPAMIHQAKR
jgi:hypothetical protein